MAKHLKPEERKSIFYATFSTEAGKKALAEIYRYCGKDRNPYDAQSSRNTDFNCGKQDVAQWIVYCLEPPKEKPNKE